MKFLTSILALSLIVLAASAQPVTITKIDGSKISSSEIDRVVNRLMDTAHVAGLALSILNNKKVIYQNTYGFKNVNTEELLDTATVFYGASLSKAVFAYLCMMMVQEGVLHLDRPLYTYLDEPIPNYKGFEDLAGDDRWKLITARMCLSHTTGFPNWRFLDVHTGEYVRQGKLAIHFTPGTRYAYSGEGLMLLQLVLEGQAGRGLEELAREKIFVPFGMSHTGYEWRAEFEEDFAYGHDEYGALLPKKWRQKAGGAGTMETTLTDYSRFIEGAMNHKGLRKDLWEEMMMPQIRIHSVHQFPTITDRTTTENDSIELAYGLGWGVLKSPYGRAFFKEGHDEGWRHYNINFVDHGTAIIIMTNSSNGERIFKELLEEAIGDTFTPWRWERYVPYGYRE